MALVRGQGSNIELIVRRVFLENGYRFRYNVKSLPGKPDLVLNRLSTVVFVNGCFWHGHHCKRGRRVPKSNRSYWIQKIGRNIKRDGAVRRKLRKEGYHVYTIWECSYARDLKRVLTYLQKLQESER
ncbi:MAG: DNA mismatch endonuclease Vsr [Candidatus Hydrogenedentes bacterium]|nr:DNA mismatch endonuclease Vsr [Candidatus Hydrogenedentota bacterium]